MFAVTKKPALVAGLLAALAGGCGEDEEPISNPTQPPASGGNPSGDGMMTPDPATPGADASVDMEVSDSMAGPMDPTDPTDPGTMEPEPTDPGPTDPGTLSCDDPQTVTGGSSCSSTDSPRAGAECIGFFCDWRQCDIEASSAPGRACASTRAMENTCDGASQEVVATCARSNAFSPDPVAETRTCARNDARMDGISDECLECYIDSASCAREFCLVQCVTGDSPQCDRCRQDNNCTPNFYACSGLPDPTS